MDREGHQRWTFPWDKMLPVHFVEKLKHRLMTSEQRKENKKFHTRKSRTLQKEDLRKQMDDLNL